MISFINESKSTTVFLSNKYIGDIKMVTRGYQYFPKGHLTTDGEIFKSLKECKDSLK